MATNELSNKLELNLPSVCSVFTQSTVAGAGGSVNCEGGYSVGVLSRRF